MRKQLSPSSYSFYPSLLDAFQAYLDAESSYDMYFGNSESPSMTVDEWQHKLFVDLINKINRVPYESEAAAKGTQFNNVIDLLVEGKTKDDKHELILDADNVTIMDWEEGEGGVKNYSNKFTFPLDLSREFADYYEGAVSQVFVKGTVDTCFGDVDIYGYLDYLLPFSVHDLKTCKYYQGGKFRKHWQHICYPFCLNYQGNEIERFEYNITDFKKTYTELYMYKAERDVPLLRNICELFINFLKTYNDLITDTRLYNYIEIENE